MSNRVVTVTLNPSIDRTINLSTLEVGRINRASSTTLDPGGKGVNVSRAAHAFGTDTHAILVCGDLGKGWMSKELSSAGISHTVVTAQGVTRSNMTIVESNGTVTKINEPGNTLNDEELARTKSALADQALNGAWVVFAGRLNPGLPASTYRDLAQFAKDKGALIAVDTSGPELKEALTAGVVDFIKPNQHELAELVGRPLVTIHDVIEAAREVISGGVARVLCSLGADGAILITENSAVHCEPGHMVSGTPVGAGDILLGIFLAAGSDVAALESAVAWSAASVPLPGTSIPTKAQAAAMPVRTNTALDQSRTLVEVD